MKKVIALTLIAALVALPGAFADDLHDAVAEDYQLYLADLFDHFHRNPELSLVEHNTAARMAMELREAGFEVTEGVGGTGVIATLTNGDGPMVMMRADMDGLPVEEKSGLPNASVATQNDPITGNAVPVPAPSRSDPEHPLREYASSAALFPGFPVVGGGRSTAPMVSIAPRVGNLP